MDFCKQVPPSLSAFVDTFVDFTVSGLFFPHPQNPPPPPPTRLPHPPRLVAIGDLHGDLPKSIEALSLAGLIDPSTLRWSGGPTVAVQVGDVLDRGGDEIRLLYLLHRLRLEAAASGGALVTMIGNHEVMNVRGDFNCAGPSGLEEFKNWGFWYQIGLSMKTKCEGLRNPKDPFKGVPKSFPGVRKEFHEALRARAAALRPDGPISKRFLSQNPTVVIVGDSVFVHGGLLQDHVKYGLDRMNREVRDWISGRSDGGDGGERSPGFVRGREAVVWLRRFSDGVCDCANLEAVLEMIPGAKRMVMGHTIQTAGINGACENRAVRIDVGLSKGCGDGLAEVLEIVDGGSVMRVIGSDRVVHRRRRYSDRTVEEKEGLKVLLPPVEVKA
ncbi:Uncharacterized protein QJS10_CPB04g01946 [Acorus calamus]|uniref:Calcineurin-like phosphoesterase domain-containing protein n=1 Tax=Acorus calamus TaxID=4465 RepID=A0AAV9F2R1_ACOCL|nr:Uncharacterized protein QJS10_CPB04g01946 [Acorus calamus]